MAKQPSNDFRREFRRIFETGQRHRPSEMFRDFCESVSLALRNNVPIKPADYDANEARYHAIREKYEPDFAWCAKAFGLLVMAMQYEAGPQGLAPDVLGETFEELELQNTHVGQFFTPYHVCRSMAQLALTDLESLVAGKDRITVLEPAGGCGRTVLAVAHEMRSRGFEPLHHMQATLVDLDVLCCWMAHITLSLAAVPATIVWGNSLTLEQWGEFDTPTMQRAFRIAMMAARIEAASQTSASASVIDVGDSQATTPEPEAVHAEIEPIARESETVGVAPQPSQTLAAMPAQLTLF